MSTVRVTVDVDLGEIDDEDLSEEITRRLLRGMSPGDIIPNIPINDILSAITDRNVQESKLKEYDLQWRTESHVSPENIVDELKLKVIKEAFDKYSLEELETRLK